MNKPDNWVILKIKEDTKLGYFYKVLAGWSGGYLDSDEWRLNSGIAAVVDEEEGYYDFVGDSGSVYRCHKGSERLSGATGMIYEQLKKKFGDSVEMIEYKDMV